MLYKNRASAICLQRSFDPYRFFIFSKFDGIESKPFGLVLHKFNYHLNRLPKHAHSYREESPSQTQFYSSKKTGYFNNDKCLKCKFSLWGKTSYKWPSNCVNAFVNYIKNYHIYKKNSTSEKTRLLNIFFLKNIFARFNTRIHSRSLKSTWLRVHLYKAWSVIVITDTCSQNALGVHQKHHRKQTLQHFHTHYK